MKKMERELDLREMLLFLWQHIAVILLCAVAGAAACGALTVYENSKAVTCQATALVILDTGEEQPEDLANRMQYYTNIANMCSVVVKSDAVLDRVAEALDLPVEGSALSGSVSLTSVSSSSFMQLTVSAADGETARAICEEILAVAPEVSQAMTGAGTLRAASDVRLLAPQTSGVAKAGAVGALLGIILGVLVLMGIELFDHTLQDAGDVQYYLDKNTLGVIPAGTTEETVAEAYRDLRTGVQSLAPDAGSWVVLVAAAGSKAAGDQPAEGLARALAEAGKKVLLADGDLRTGKLSERLGAKGAPGLAELLQKKTTVEEALRPGEGTGLTLLPCGTAGEHPADLLDPAALQSLFAALRRQFDCIVVQAPDAAAANDAALLGKNADGVLLVAQARRTEIETALLAKERVLCGGAPVWGVVLTGYEWKKAKRRDGYYYAFSAARR